MIKKLLAVGPQGSGKTRAIMEVSNFLNNKIQYSWDEESNLKGTNVVVPYSLSLSDEEKLIIADNPGQNSLEMVRKSVAQSGANYNGIIIFTDAIQFNFREIGFIHAASISQYLKQDGLPVIMITTKADLIQRFYQANLLNKICSTLENVVQNCYQGQKISYYDRVREKEDYFELTVSNDWILFTEIEQLLINALDEEFSTAKISGITPMNIRLMVRSLLLGYCEFYKEKHFDYIKQYPIFNAIYDDDELINSLNYNRPSAKETVTPWRYLAAQSKSKIVNKNEIPFQKSAFLSKNIEYVFREYCFAIPTKHMEFEGIIRQKAYNKKWHFIGSTFTDSLTSKGIRNTAILIEKLCEEIS
ncbi:MAG: hypothetical protein ACFFD1_12245 [Candidatus Thorarchaeota archaeon]